MGNSLEEIQIKQSVLEQIKNNRIQSKNMTFNLKPSLIEANRQKIVFQYIAPLILQNQNQELMQQYQQFKPITQNQNVNLTNIDQSQRGLKSSNQNKKISVLWNSFVKIKKKNYQDDYKKIKSLGKGGFGTVFKVQMKNQNQLKRAAKIIKSDKLSSRQQLDKLNAQISIPIKLDHPNIVKLHQVYQNKEKLVLILELCEGGDLFQRVRMINNVSQKTAAQAMFQILSAVVYIHKMGFVHRDIKPENILYNEISNLFKIADFGTATQLVPNQRLSKITGSPFYIAPQVLDSDYDEKCDVWSCGIVLYVLLTGAPPFFGQTKKQIFTKIKSEELNLSGQIWENRSNQVKKLIQSMLNKNPKERISALDALNSAWIKQAPNLNKQNQLSNQLGREVLSNLRSFSFGNKLQAVVYTYIASQLYQNKQKSMLLKAFQQIDLDQDGMIGRDQLMRVFESSNIRQKISEEQLQSILSMVDFNGSGLIDFTQFLVAASKQQNLLDLKKLQHAFDYFDNDKNGYITADQIKQFLDINDQPDDDQIKKIFQDVDTNGDGNISKEQFLDLMLSRKSGA